VRVVGEQAGEGDGAFGAGQGGAEADNIRRLVNEGCKRYILMTNLEGSATPGSGTRDQIEDALSELSKTHGVQMSCIWASDLDAWVDLVSRVVSLLLVG